MLPILLLAGLFLWMMNRAQGGGGRVMQFGRSRHKQVSKDQPKTTFKDVAGVDEAVEELEEVKEYLQHPAKFQAIGAKIPRGVLLFGPPGTGKTCWPGPWPARPASRSTRSVARLRRDVRGRGAAGQDLFEQAKASAPAIVFVDEIDAVGRTAAPGSAAATTSGSRR